MIEDNDPFVTIWKNRNENLTESYSFQQLPTGVMFKYWVQQEPNPPDVSLEFVPGIMMEFDNNSGMYVSTVDPAFLIRPPDQVMGDSDHGPADPNSLNVNYDPGADEEVDEDFFVD